MLKFALKMVLLNPGVEFFLVQEEDHQLLVKVNGLLVTTTSTMHLDQLFVVYISVRILENRRSLSTVEK